MSKTIDQKVVEMRFDNGQFERGIAQSTNSINNLQSSLNKFSSGSFSSGLSSLSGNFVQFNNTISQGGAAFSALEEIAIGALRKIGETVVNLGESFISNLWGKLQAGFNRYESMMKSTQAIMYATRNDWEDQGEQMEYVTAQIEKLQWYADETSYSLTDMTSSVGKFISAGIPLEDAVKSMMGISSWAALSGQGAEQASRAMYNLSQAMGMGKVTLMDWRSIENANMATREFKGLAIEAGLAMDTLHEKSDGTIVAFDRFGNEVEVTIDSFRNSLATGWFDSDVLTSVLSEYGDFAIALNGYVNDLGITTTEMISYVSKAVDAGLSDIDWDENAEEGKKIIQDIAKEAGIGAGEIDAFGEALRNLADDEYAVGRAAFMAGQESKTLTDSLDYTKDALMTAWSNVWTNIIGDYLRSKEVWTQFSEMLYEQLVYPVEKLNDKLAFLKDIGAFDKLKEALLNFYEVFAKLREAVTEGFEEVSGYKFAPKVVGFFDKLIELSEKLKKLFHNFTASKWGFYTYYDDFDNIKRAAEAVSKAFGNFAWNVKTIGKDLIKAWKKIFPSEGMDDDFTLHLKEAAEAFKDFTSQFILSGEQSDKITAIFENLLNTIKNLWESLKSFAGAIADAWKEIFPPKDASEVIDGVLGGIQGVTGAISNMSEKFKITDDRAEKIKRAFKGLFAILDILRSLFVAILSPIMGINVEAGEMGDGLLDVAAGIGDWLVSVRDWLAENKVFETAVQKVTEFIQNIPVYAEQASQALFGMSLAELWEDIKQKAVDAWNTLKQFFAWLVGMFTKSGEEGGEMSEEISGDMTEGFSEFTEEKGQGFKDFCEKIGSGLDTLKSKWEEAKPYIDQFFQMFKENVDFEMPSMEEIGDTGKNAAAIAVLAGIAAIIWNLVRALTNLDKDKKKIVNSIKYMFTSIGDAAKALKNNIKAQTFKTIATAILEVAAAIFILTLLPTTKMLFSAAVIAILIAEIGKIFEMITGVKASEKRMVQMKNLLLSLEAILATMIGGIVAIALATDITASIAAASMIGVLLGIFTGLMYVIGKMKINTTAMKALVPLVDSLAVLIGAMGAAILIGSTTGNASAIAAAGASIAVMLAIVVWFFKEIDNKSFKSMTKPKVDQLVRMMTSVSILIGAMGTALLIATTSRADWSSLLAAGAAMSGMMIALAYAIKIMPNKSGMENLGTTLIMAGVAFALMGTALAFATSSGADWVQLAVAGTVLAGMIMALALAFSLMPNSATIIEGAAALAVASVGILLIATALATLSNMSLEQVGVALLALAGALVIVLAAGFAATYVSVGLLALGAAIALIGAGAMMAGLGMMMFAEGIEKLFSLDPEGAMVLLTTIATFFEMFPAMMENVALGILAFVNVFVQARQSILEAFVGAFETMLQAYMTIMPQIIQAVTMTVLAIIQAYMKIMPKVVEAVTMTVIAIIESMRQTLPHVMAFLTELTLAIMQFIVDTTPTFVETVIFVLTALFDGFIRFTHENLPKLVDLITFVVTELCRSIAETTSVIVATLIAMLIDVLTQVKDNIAEIVSLSVEIAIEIVMGLLDGLAEGIPKLAAKGIDCLLAILNGIADGLEDKAEDIRRTMDNVAKSLLNAFKTILGIHSPSTVFSDIGGNIMQGLIDGISDMIDKVKETISGVAETVSTKFKELLGIESPSKVFAQYGKFIDEGLSRGMQKNTWMVSDATEEVGDTAIDGMSKVISDISEVVENGIDYQPTIRPVLDLTNVTEGIDTMNGMLSDSSAVDLASSNSDMINGKISRLDAFSMSLDSIREALGHNKKGDRGFGTQNNTFNITGDNPKEIANQVNYILQQQVERKEAVWAH